MRLFGRSRRQQLPDLHPSAPLLSDSTELGQYRSTDDLVRRYMVDIETRLGALHVNSTLLHVRLQEDANLRLAACVLCRNTALRCIEDPRLRRSFARLDTIGSRVRRGFRNRTAEVRNALVDLVELRNAVIVSASSASQQCLTTCRPSLAQASQTMGHLTGPRVSDKEY